MLNTITKDDRMRLMRFVCTFAWADLEVQEAEREFIGRMILALQLDPDEAGRVMEWMEVPPSVDLVDPEDVPKHHKQLFLDAVQAVVERDGTILPSERESLDVLRQILR